MHIPHFSTDVANLWSVVSGVCSTAVSLTTLTVLIKRTGGLRGIRTEVRAATKSIEKRL